MGLSIVKSIVDAMGGSIEVSSTEGKGTVFTVHLDLDLIQSEMKDGSQDETNKADEAEFPGLIGKRALICEDNALNLQIVETILERSGMLTDGAENGQEGLNMFLASKPGYYDIILMDLRMPVMSGIAAAKAIRELDRPDSLSVPIIAVSADAYQENVDECIASGMNGHIAKPIDASVLLKTVYEQLK
jgi:FOG: CheY-like receiver